MRPSDVEWPTGAKERFKLENGVLKFSLQMSVYFIMESFMCQGKPFLFILSMNYDSKLGGYVLVCKNYVCCWAISVGGTKHKMQKKYLEWFTTCQEFKNSNHEMLTNPQAPKISGKDRHDYQQTSSLAIQQRKMSLVPSQHGLASISHLIKRKITDTSLETAN